MTPRQVVKALRDAEAKGWSQTIYCLIRLPEETGNDYSSYCALGAIFKQAGATDEEINQLGYRLADQLGIDFDGWTMENIYELNDESNMSFGQIAEEFEQHLDSIGHPQDDTISTEVPT